MRIGPVVRTVVSGLWACAVLAGCADEEESPAEKPAGRSGISHTGSVAGGDTGAEAVIDEDAGRVGSPAANFSLKDIEGNELTLYGEGGERPVTLLVFWATWSKESMKEVSAIERLYRTDKKVNVRTVSVDEPGVDVPTFVKKTELTYPVGLDGNGSVAKRYAARVMPVVFVIDGKGVIRYRGAKVEEALEVIEAIRAGRTGQSDTGSPSDAEETESEDMGKEDSDGNVEG